MAELAQSYKDQLKRIKKNIEKAHIYFRKNYDRFHEFQRFIFKTALNEGDIEVLQSMGKPIIEFNITNAYVSRLCGEFSKQIPSVEVHAEVGNEIDPKVIEAVEGHMRHIFFEANKRNVQYNVYKDQLSGGFSDIKVFTEYASETGDNAFDQIIKIDRVYEPTLVGHDPMSRADDKSDAEYCFELVPMNKDTFKIHFPEVDVDAIDFNKSVGDFNWAYTAGADDIIVVAYYYEKKRRKQQIVKLANKKVMTMDKYKEFLIEWQTAAYTQQPPGIMGKPRWATMEYVCRYTLIGSEVLKYKKTDFKYLPLVFFDGDSVVIREGEHEAFQQFTKPYVYHVKGAQRLKNFAGQCLGNDFESMVMHKFKVAKESLPQEQEYLDAYTNVAQANTLVYNQYMDGDPDKQLNPPQEIARVPIPQEVPNTFMMADQMVQNILGSYDASLGINDNQLSGIAIVEAATQSNAAAMPYVVAHMRGLNQVANIILDLLPKYYVTPRTIPVVNRDGERSFTKINQEGGVDFNYDSNALNVRVEAGPNFSIQKSRAINQVSLMMQSSPMFGQFMNDEGLDFILDNMEFKGSDVLAERAKEWMQRQKQAQQQAAQQPNPEMIKAQVAQQALQQKVQEMQMKAQLDMAKLKVEQEKVAIDKIDSMLRAGESRNKMLGEIAKSKAEMVRASADIALKHKDMQHNHLMDVANYHQQAKKDKRDG